MNQPRTKMQDPLTRLESTISEWAYVHDDVRAIIVVGSRARSVHPADAWSDLDLILFSSQPERYATSAVWLDAWGEVWAPALSQVAGGLPEWLVLMAGGAKVDVVIAPAGGTLAEMVARSPFQNVLSRGVRVLVDRTGSHARSLPRIALQPSTPPTAFDFANACFAFIVAADKTLRLLRRSELWRAKLLCDADLKARLLVFLEWQAQARHGPEYDTWYDGRFMHEWLDAAVLSAVPATFAAYDQADIWRALKATVVLFQQLALDIAERWGLAYPARAGELLLEQLADVTEGAPNQGRQEMRSSTQP